MLAPLMKNKIATNPAYRKVVAALDDCEKRYDGLMKRTGATNDLRLASTVAILKGEVEHGSGKRMAADRAKSVFGFSGRRTDLRRRTQVPPPLRASNGVRNKSKKGRINANQTITKGE